MRVPAGQQVVGRDRLRRERLDGLLVSHSSEWVQGGCHWNSRVAAGVGGAGNEKPRVSPEL
jgi:hypothetical protein